MTNTKPEIGMPTLFSIGSDHYSGVIADIRRNGRTVIWVGSVWDAESRSYKIPELSEENIKQFGREFTLRANGRYVSKGQNCGTLSVGNDGPTELDPSF